MSRAAAFRLVEDYEGEGAPASIPDLPTPSPIPESGMRRCRSAADTLPVSEAELAAARPDWCVDTGAELRPMSTFDLWSAIERADVAPWMRVWREGLECWTPVQELSELRWATHAAALASLDDSPFPAAPELLPPERTPANEAREEARPGRTLPGLAAAPEPRDSIVTPTPTVAAPPPAAPAAEATRAARWLAAGSTVAALSIGAALLYIAGPLSTAAPPALAAPAAVEPAPALAAPPAAEPSEARPASYREERGQRRLPRGGRRASYGR